MVLLVCFDLPRYTKDQRRQATKYRKRLVELGFFMKQYSLYERQIRRMDTKNKLISILQSELPQAGQITLYLLPDEINDQQITILGDEPQKLIHQPQLLIF
ncbi:CRISPR-associated endonuclease Cas2 [Liquorilactobacillus sicerae]|uniref:CRISPR-associated endonuclease Cas2 n=1 Tax=Liquorilactobacillus sicerae TaxID=1416943 RepID=UPI002481570D|nr:CRISPR-associated endonuclease Cas2 [Liquorilactobacillus sicerae]